MKRISLVAAFAVSLLSLSAESVTINHTTAGGLKAELNAAIEASETLTSMADITDLTISGEAAMTATDFLFIQDNLTTTLVSLDLTTANCHSLPDKGKDYPKDGSLAKMTALKKVLLPENLTTLGNGSFYNCTALEYVNLPDGIGTISQYCFSGCKKFNTEKLPANLQSIQPDAFRYCESLTLSELPESVWQIRGYAFAESGVTFEKLPSSLTQLAENSFQKSKVTFSEFPEGLKTIPSSAFAGTKVQFTELSPNITSVGAYAFQSVKTMPEFTITNQANLWTKIPDGCFFVQTDDVQRTFICRAPSAPAANCKTGSGVWTGSFSQVVKNPNTTFKVLASAMESFQTTAPYNSMNLVALTTPVLEPVIELPDGITANQVKVSLTVNGIEQTDLTDVLEGEGLFKVEFSEEADSKLYVEEIRYVAPAANEDEVLDDEPVEETDPNLLYKADGDSSQLLKKSVEVPVTVVPEMNAISVKFALGNPVSGVETVNEATNSITRQGDVFYTTLPGAEIFDISGRLVVSSTSNSIDISSLPAGAYILRAGKSIIKILK